MKKHSASERLLAELIKKGSLKHPNSLKKVSSPYSNPPSTSEKPHSRSKEVRPSIADATLTVIEEKVSRSNRLSRNHSFTADKSHISPSPQRHIPDISESIMTLNKSLTEKLKTLGPNYDINQRFAVFQYYFSQAIGLDATLGLFLRRIKAGYEEFVTVTVKAEVMQAQTERQLEEFQAVLEQEQTEKESLLSTIAELRRDKTNLTSKLVTKTAKIKSLERELDESVSTTKSTEDKTALHDMIRTLQEEVFLLRSREQMLAGVVKSAKEHGFPIEQLLAKHRKTVSLHRNSHKKGFKTNELSPITPENDGSLASFARDMDISGCSKEGK